MCLTGDVVLFASVEFVVFGGELFLEGFLDGVTDEDVLVSDGDHEGDERGDFGVHLDHFLKSVLV